MTAGKSIPREVAETLVVALIVALFVRTFLVQAFKIPTGSMEHNLLVGDHVVVNRFVFGPAQPAAARWALPVREIARGDIVVFKFPKDPSRDFVKRVIGLPGETVEVRGRRVHVDGRPLDEPFATFLQPPSDPGDRDEHTAPDVRIDYGPVLVPPGHLFVMGDNRDNSEDSRYWGFLPRSHVKGLALVVYWSFDPEPVRTGGIGGWFARLSGHTRWGRVLTPTR